MSSTATAQALKHRFTVDDYYQMARAGIFRDDDRVELIDGEIVDMTPIGSEHAAAVSVLGAGLTRGIGDRAIVRVQCPVRLELRSEPQPDVVVVKTRRDRYRHGHPAPEDVLLIVEIADTSLEYDRGVKLALYARAVIPETWIVDLAGACVEVYTNPTPNGYRDIARFRRGARVAPTSFPDVQVAVDDIVG